MGLTIHFQLALRPDAPDMDEHRARWAVEDARRLAMEMKRRGAFVAVTRIAHEPQVVRRQAGEFVRYNHPRHGEQYCEAVPLRGWVFVADMGADCEPLRIGLCEYPAHVWHLGDDRATRLHGWRLAASSKTQYASLHGWEHFRRCHVAIVDFLAALRPLGFVVKISDEGHYWPRRSERALHTEIEKMNRLVAAAAGAMKDAHEDSGGVQAAIFAHPQFERLEAEGADLLAKRT